MVQQDESYELAQYDEDFADVMAVLDREPPVSVILDLENPVVAGRAVRVEDATTKYGPTKVLVLERGGQEFSVWLLHTVLRNELERRRPKAGDKIAIRYLGRSAEGDYHNYKVAVVPAAGSSLELTDPRDEVPAIEAEVVAPLPYTQGTEATTTDTGPDWS